MVNAIIVVSVLAQVECSGYYFRYFNPKPNAWFIGEPIVSNRWPRANLHEKPAKHVFVDENGKTICLEDVKEKESYRIKTLVTTHPGYEYMYMTEAGTNIYFYNIHFWLI